MVIKNILIGIVAIVVMGVIASLIVLVGALLIEVRGLTEEVKELKEENKKALTVEQEANCKKMAEDRLHQLAEAHVIKVDQERATPTLARVRLEAKTWKPGTQREHFRRWILGATPVLIISDDRAVRSETPWELTVVLYDVGWREEALSYPGGNWEHLSSYCSTNR